MSGETLGKRMLKIKTVNPQGTKPDIIYGLISALLKSSIILLTIDLVVGAIGGPQIEGGVRLPQNRISQHIGKVFAVDVRYVNQMRQ